MLKDIGLHISRGGHYCRRRWGAPELRQANQFAHLLVPARRIKWHQQSDSITQIPRQLSRHCYFKTDKVVPIVDTNQSALKVLQRWIRFWWATREKRHVSVSPHKPDCPRFSKLRRIQHLFKRRDVWVHRIDLRRSDHLCFRRFQAWNRNKPKHKLSKFGAGPDKFKPHQAPSRVPQPSFWDCRQNESQDADRVPKERKPRHSTLHTKHDLCVSRRPRAVQRVGPVQNQT